MCMCMCVSACARACALVCACTNTGKCSCFVCAYVECLCESVPHKCAVCM